MLICKECSTKNSDRFTYCKECGSKLTVPKTAIKVPSQNRLPIYIIMAMLLLSIGANVFIYTQYSNQRNENYQLSDENRQLSERNNELRSEISHYGDQIQSLTDTVYYYEKKISELNEEYSKLLRKYEDLKENC